MATGTLSFSGSAYKFDISYSYTNTSFNLTSVKTTALQSGWGAWEQQPTLFLYALKGTNPVPKDAQQYDAAGTTIKSHITNNNGKYQIAYNGDNPGAYLPNTSGTSVTWNSSDYDDIVLSLSGSSQTITVGAAIANTTGTLNDAVYGYDSVTLSLYTAPSGYGLEVTEQTTNYITVKHNWTAGSVNNYPTSTITIKSSDNSYTETKTVNRGSSASFTGLASNTQYTIVGVANDGTTNLTKTINAWTKPVIGNLALALAQGLEHDKINAAATAQNISSYDQYSFKLNDGSYSAYSATNAIDYSSLNGNTQYTVTVKLKNTSSGFESAEVSKTITTWHDPISNLKVSLMNRWFWYLQINSSHTYTGTISKYEFAIGNEGYQNRSTTNSYSKGSTTGGASGNLNYNTDYVCKVRLTDNHGRTAEASATFKTMDERALYVNGELREVKVIKPDGSITYITPNLLSVVKPNGTLTNMNQIINNDSRTEFK